MKPFKDLSKDACAEFVFTNSVELVIAANDDSVTLLSDEVEKLTRFLVKFYTNGAEAIFD